ncbi:MAG: 23S rRNA (guanosine(2251)-2'-O)-methyltransferase RlmB [Opitutales bacterium]|nr:23S rRNA (guanosine(2251)-2'-O)-methyltransferase RlmB [Opitutales bacterium]
MGEILYGRNAIRECLIAGRRKSYRLIVAEKLDNSPIVNEIFSLARANSLGIDRMPRKKMDAKGINHQGMMLETTNYPLVDVGDMLALAEERGEDPFLIAFDHLEDPHNLGAIIRTAESVGVHGIIIPNQRQSDITPAVVKASVGATEHTLVAKVSNLTQTLNQLKKRNLWVTGVQADPNSKSFDETDLGGPNVIVIGSEGPGMSRLVRDTCDFLVEIPMKGKIDSLNASVASAIVLYETWRTRKFEGRR